MDLTLYIDLATGKLTGPSSGLVPIFYRGDKPVVTLYFLKPTNNAGLSQTFKIFTSPTWKVGIGSPATLPTYGTFLLKDGAQSTAAIAFNAAAASVQSAITAGLTTNWAAATVTGAAGGPWQIDRGANGAASALTSDVSNLLPASQAVIDVIAAGAAAQHAIQLVSLLQLPFLTQNSWSLTSDGLGYTASLDFTIPLIDEFLNAQSSISSTLELEVTESSNIQTALQTPCTILNDLNR